MNRLRLSPSRFGTAALVLAALSVGRVVAQWVPEGANADRPFERAGAVNQPVHLRYADVIATTVDGGKDLAQPYAGAMISPGLWVVTAKRLHARRVLAPVGVVDLDGAGTDDRAGVGDEVNADPPQPKAGRDGHGLGASGWGPHIRRDRNVLGNILDTGPCAPPDAPGPGIALVKGGDPPPEDLTRPPAYDRYLYVPMPHEVRPRSIRVWFETPKYAEFAVTS